jgi:hypothetical protein
MDKGACKYIFVWVETCCAVLLPLQMNLGSYSNRCGVVRCGVVDPDLGGTMTGMELGEMGGFFFLFF